jgi:hypothetical protein
MSDNLNLFALAATLSKLGYTVENDGTFRS